MRVLLVDDSPGDIMLLREAMDEAGMARQCHAVHNGEEAMNYLLKDPPYADAPRPDLIVMDIRLPIMSGIEVMQKLHHRPEFSKIPMVLLSGVQRDQRECCSYWHEEMCLYLVKPMSFSGYVDAVGAIKEFLASICPSDG